MRAWIDEAGSLRRKLTLYPELPDPQAAMNMSLHEVIEQELGEGGGGEALARVWDALEGFRGSALEYWMAVTRPLPGEEEAKSAGSPRKRRKADATKATDRGLLAREDELIKWLRGAWFLVLHDSLPRHFERYAAESSVFQAFRERGPGLSTEVGRKEYSQVKKQLEELHQEMVAVMPLYARKRQQKWAGWTDLVSAATAHQRHGQRAQSHTR